MTKFYYVRHGESTANVDGVSAGWSDVALTDNGRQQAALAAEAIKKSGLKFDKIISSPLSRTLDTAKIIAQIIDYPVDNIVVIEDMKEKSAGSMELGPKSVLFSKTEEEFAELGGENAEMFRTRVKRLIPQIRKESEGASNVLIVAHSGVFKMLYVVSRNLEPATKMYDVDRPKFADLVEIQI